jgi:molybdopterin converting factor subunit 1
MTLSVKLFAKARDLAGAERVSIGLPEPATVRDLRDALKARYPALAPIIQNLLVAVGNDYASEGTHLSPLSDVACFPPVSGG